MKTTDLQELIARLTQQLAEANAAIEFYKRTLAKIHSDSEM